MKLDFCFQDWRSGLMLRNSITDELELSKMLTPCCATTFRTRLLVLGTIAALSMFGSIELACSQDFGGPANNGLDEFGVPRSSPTSFRDQVRFSAEYQIASGTNSGVVMLTADIVEGCHIYALQQPGKELPPSKIKIAKTFEFSVDRFVPDSKPTLVKNDPVFNSDIAKHKGKVVFWAPIKLVAGQSHENLAIDLTFHGSVCSDAGMCFPIQGEPIKVAFGGYYDRKEKKNR